MGGLGWMSLGSSHPIPEAPTLSSQGKAAVGGLQVTPTFTGVIVSQLGTEEINFSKEKPGPKTPPPSAAPGEIMPANRQNTHVV